MFYVLCQTPPEHCTGKVEEASHGLLLHQRAHQSHDDAFRCYVHYLVHVQGYQRLDSRAYHRPGEPVLVVTKRSHYGARMRTGGVEKARRVMPRVLSRAVLIG